MAYLYLIRSCGIVVTLIGQINWIIVSSVLAQDGEIRVVTKYWADKVINVSSEFDLSPGWEAFQILGAPNVYPGHRDVVGAWAQNGKSRNNAQFIEVGFSEALILLQVDIYETWRAGGIRRLTARLVGNQSQTLLYHNDTVTELLYSRIFSPPIPDVPCAVNAIRIDVDCTAGDTPHYVEIDAVQIQGFTECSQGKWGLCCDNICGKCSDNNKCNKTTGICPTTVDYYRCAAGYRGDMCDQECDSGQFGKDCLEKCGSCSGGEHLCSKTSGVCPPVSPRCAPGYKGGHCEDNCSPGDFGADCNDKCGECAGGSEACSAISGECSGTPACLPGYAGTLCTTECINGTWGEDCKNRCSIHCKMGTADCDRHTGWCDLRCRVGFEGDMCVPFNFTRAWAEDCFQRCADDCLQPVPGGSCDSRRSETSFQNTKITMSVIGGGVGLVIGVVLAGIVFFIWRSRRPSDDKERPGMNDSSTAPATTVDGNTPDPGRLGDVEGKRPTEMSLDPVEGKSPLETEYELVPSDYSTCRFSKSETTNMYVNLS